MRNLISETKIGNTFPVVNFVYLDTQHHSHLTAEEREEVLSWRGGIWPCRMFSKFTFEKEIEAS